MTDREAYKMKLEAELEKVEANLLRMKASAKSSAAGAQIEYNKRIAQLEEKLAAAKARLSEIGDATDESWESMKAGLESAWSSIADSVKEAFGDSGRPPKA